MRFAQKILLISEKKKETTATLKRLDRDWTTTEQDPPEDPPAEDQPSYTADPEVEGSQTIRVQVHSSEEDNIPLAEVKKQGVFFQSDRTTMVHFASSPPSVLTQKLKIFLLFRT